MLAQVDIENNISCSKQKKCFHGTVKTLDNGHFGIRLTVRYSGYVLYSGVIVVPTFNITFDKTLKQ